MEGNGISTESETSWTTVEGFGASLKMREKKDSRKFQGILLFSAAKEREKIDIIPPKMAGEVSQAKCALTSLWAVAP